MDILSKHLKTPGNSGIFFFILPALFIIALNNYLIFHSIVELFYVIVAINISILCYKTYKYSENAHSLFMGCSYFAVAIFIFLHLLSYDGMNIFKNITANVPTQLWIASRYIQVISLFISIYLLKHRNYFLPAFMSLMFITIGLAVSIIPLGIFPDCYIPGRGLTVFKILSEYITSLLFLLVVLILTIYRKRLDRTVYTFLTVSLIFNIFSSLAFTLYNSPFALTNIVGHIFSLVSNYFIYHGIFLKGIDAPYDRLETAYHKTIEGWSKALELRDIETKGHSDRVTHMTVELAKSYGIKGKDLTNVYRGALLHDIGKIGVPDNILLKPGPLTEEEWTVMRKHPQYSRELISTIDHLQPAMDIPYSHHEKWDGTGYPLGLRGLEIPLSARLFAVVDVWDALSSDRPYRKGWPKEKIAEHINSLSGTHFDPEIVSLFIKLSGRM